MLEKVNECREAGKFFAEKFPKSEYVARNRDRILKIEAAISGLSKMERISTQKFQSAIPKERIAVMIDGVLGYEQAKELLGNHSAVTRLWESISAFIETLSLEQIEEYLNEGVIVGNNGVPTMNVAPDIWINRADTLLQIARQKGLSDGKECVLRLKSKSYAAARFYYNATALLNAFETNTATTSGLRQAGVQFEKAFELKAEVDLAIAQKNTDVGANVHEYIGEMQTWNHIGRAFELFRKKYGSILNPAAQ
jgi:hypothetical protein